jgi:hypothetical protein
LLRGLEQPRRSTLADHVHRPSQLGPWVLINESWYKMREAWIFEGEFKGRRNDKDKRNKKVADLWAVIERHVMVGAYIVIPSVVFKQYASLIDHPKADNPYFSAVFNMMIKMSELEDAFGITEPVDFTFDFQQGMELPVQEAWDALKAFPQDRVKRRLGKRPQFDDDKVSMPLQAADLHAWWVRRRYEDMVSKKEPIPLLWEPKRDMSSINIVVTEEEIADFFASIETALNSCLTFSWGMRRFIEYSHWNFAVEQPFLRLDQIGRQLPQRRTSGRLL